MMANTTVFSTGSWVMVCIRGEDVTFTPGSGKGQG
ncbi:MAG: hypothetical protein A4E40_01435 [Methanoregulaceae archaeon PtaU1.Bin059]|jgi:hypothetical protein|nr:MAG: hypothetical protein A4E40_01435 [Methanoregulaceae archaeon PtaU1.Bin059]